MKSEPILPESVERGLRALHRAVRKELEKKSKLGQYVIVYRNGKTVHMLASEALKPVPSEQNEGETDEKSLTP